MQSLCLWTPTLPLHYLHMMNWSLHNYFITTIRPFSTSHCSTPLEWFSSRNGCMALELNSGWEHFSRLLANGRSHSLLQTSSIAVFLCYLKKTMWQFSDSGTAHYMMPRPLYDDPNHCMMFINSTISLKMGLCLVCFHRTGQFTPTWSLLRFYIWPLHMTGFSLGKNNCFICNTNLLVWRLSKSRVALHDHYKAVQLLHSCLR